jgi:hypothetical protein
MRTIILLRHIFTTATVLCVCIKLSRNATLVLCRLLLLGRGDRHHAVVRARARRAGREGRDGGERVSLRAQRRVRRGRLGKGGGLTIAPPHSCLRSFFLLFGLFAHTVPGTRYSTSSHSFIKPLYFPMQHVLSAPPYISVRQQYPADIGERMDFHSDFHVFAVEWDKGSLTYFVAGLY